MIKDHFLNFDTFNGIELVGQLQAFFFVAGHFEDQEAIGRTEFFADFVKPQARFDAATVLAEQTLDRIDMPESVSNMYAEDDMFIHGHRKIS
jgi:hypothetical protein